ncbi:MAG TPA: hypothetical protein ENL42_06590 [Thermoplasmatales archaeon]|nr:hypothetical protein [Thermoplasmatales archaeon]
MKCAYCNEEIEGEEELFKEGKYWHRRCLRKWLREKGC